MATLKRDCPHCGTAAMTFTVTWSAHHLGENFRFIAVATCGGCGLPICFRAMNGNSNNQPTTSGMDIERAKFIIGDIWPKAPAPEIPRHTDPELVGKLEEAEKSFAAGLNTGAAGLYRAVLDSTTRKQLKDASLAEGGTLDARIKRLAENHIIPSAVADWAHEVRVIGNEGLHEGPVVSREDAEMTRSFALTYLRYAFELPGDIAARRTPSP